MQPITALRTVAAVLIAPVVAGALHSLITDVFSLLQLTSPDWRFILASFYGYLFIGFVFAGVAARLAPARDSKFVGVVVLGSVLGGVTLGLGVGGGRFAAVTIALAVVAGTIGYSFRLRGFSESLHATRASIATPRDGRSDLAQTRV